jgi:hypothetical protein
MPEGLGTLPVEDDEAGTGLSRGGHLRRKETNRILLKEGSNFKQYGDGGVGRLIVQLTTHKESIFLIALVKPR